MFAIVEASKVVFDALTIKLHLAKVILSIKNHFEEKEVKLKTSRNNSASPRQFSVTQLRCRICKAGKYIYFFI